MGAVIKAASDQPGDNHGSGHRDFPDLLFCVRGTSAISAPPDDEGGADAALLETDAGVCCDTAHAFRFPEGGDASRARSRSRPVSVSRFSRCKSVRISEACW